MAAILADCIFKCIFLNENDRVPIRISLKFVPRSPVNNTPELVQVAWHQTGDKPLSESSSLSHIWYTPVDELTSSLVKTCFTAISQVLSHFQILHRAWQWYSHALCKILKWFDNWNRYYIKISQDMRFKMSSCGTSYFVSQHPQDFLSL